VSCGRTSPREIHALEAPLRDDGRSLTETIASLRHQHRTARSRDCLLQQLPSRYFALTAHVDSRECSLLPHGIS